MKNDIHKDLSDTGLKDIVLGQEDIILKTEENTPLLHQIFQENIEEFNNNLYPDIYCSMLENLQEAQQIGEQNNEKFRKRQHYFSEGQDSQNRIDFDIPEINQVKPIKPPNLLYPSILGHRHSFPFFDTDSIPDVKNDEILYPSKNFVSTKEDIQKKLLKKLALIPTPLPDNILKATDVIKPLPTIYEPVSSVYDKMDISISKSQSFLTNTSIPVVNRKTIFDERKGSLHQKFNQPERGAFKFTTLALSNVLQNLASPFTPKTGSSLLNLPLGLTYNNAVNAGANVASIQHHKYFMGSSATRLFGSVMGSGMLIPPSPGSSVHFYIGTNPHGSMASVMTNGTPGFHMLMPYAAPFYFQPVLLKDKYPHYYRQHFQQIAKTVTDDPNYLANSDSFVISESGALVLCRICQTPGTEETLISPCKCTGSVRYVHKNCLTKWLDMNPNRNRKSQTCELCQYTYRRAKKFKVKDWKWPECTTRDKLFHALFVISMMVMIGCAASFIVCFKNDKGIRKPEEMELNEGEIVTLSCGVLFFLSFFLGMYAEIKAHNPIYKVFGQALRINQSWIIDEYYATDQDDRADEGYPSSEDSDNDDQIHSSRRRASSQGHHDTISNKSPVGTTKSSVFSPLKNGKNMITALFSKSSTTSAHKQLLSPTGSSAETNDQHHHHVAKSAIKNSKNEARSPKHRRRRRKLRTLKTLLEETQKDFEPPYQFENELSSETNDAYANLMNDRISPGITGEEENHQLTLPVTSRELAYQSGGSNPRNLPTSLFPGTFTLSSNNSNTVSIAALSRINVLPTIKEVIGVPNSSHTLMLDNKNVHLLVQPVNFPPAIDTNVLLGGSLASLRQCMPPQATNVTKNHKVLPKNRERTFSEDQAMFYSDPSMKTVYDPFARHMSLPTSNVLQPQTS